MRTDFLNRTDYCGLFRTPTLRNVALKKSFFHNGYFHSLRDVVSFYADQFPNDDRTYLNNLVAQQTGLAPDMARTRVDGVIMAMENAKATAKDAARAPSATA